MTPEPADDLRDDTVLTYRGAVTPDALWLLRQLLEQWLVEHHVMRDDVDDLLVIANELCTDVVRRGLDDAIDITVRLGDGVVEVDVVEPPSARRAADEPIDVALVAAYGAEVTRRVRADGAHLGCRHPVRRAS